MKAYTITNVGKVRTENQDCVLYFKCPKPRHYVLVLCDGMGGANAGSVASTTAHKAFTEKVSDLIAGDSRTDLCELVKRAAIHANEAVFQQASENPEYAGMGTTLVAAVFRGTRCCIANIGDSRAYLISDGEIKQISSDHSFVEDMVKSGAITKEQARTHPNRNVITRALGSEQTVECDIFTPEFKKDDILLLCSDGLTNTVSDEELAEIVQRNNRLSVIGQELLALALSRGAPDNVTIGLIQK